MKPVQKDCEKGAKVVGKTTDISKIEVVKKLAGYVDKKFGGAHIIYHSAGARGAADDFLKLTNDDAMMEELAEERDCSMADAEDWFVKNKRPHIAMQRRGRPEEVAAVVAFLCSEHASFINGSNIRIDGGAVESAFG